MQRPDSATLSGRYYRPRRPCSSSGRFRPQGLEQPSLDALGLEISVSNVLDGVMHQCQVGINLLALVVMVPQLAKLHHHPL